jgi:hypothetical protein
MGIDKKTYDDLDSNSEQFDRAMGKVMRKDFLEKLEKLGISEDSEEAKKLMYGEDVLKFRRDLEKESPEEKNKRKEFSERVSRDFKIEIDKQQDEEEDQNKPFFFRLISFAKEHKYKLSAVALLLISFTIAYQFIPFADDKSPEPIIVQDSIDQEESKNDSTKFTVVESDIITSTTATAKVEKIIIDVTEKGKEKQEVPVENKENIILNEKTLKQALEMVESLIEDERDRYDKISETDLWEFHPQNSPNPTKTYSNPENEEFDVDKFDKNFDESMEKIVESIYRWYLYFSEDFMEKNTREFLLDYEIRLEFNDLNLHEINNKIDSVHQVYNVELKEKQAQAFKILKEEITRFSKNYYKIKGILLSVDPLILKPPSSSISDTNKTEIDTTK